MKPRLVHGTPITPRALLDQLQGESFCVSFADDRDIERCIELVADDGVIILDNGAFTIWQAQKAGKTLPKRLQFRDADEYRRTFWAWANYWMAICDKCVAVIPDVIEGSEADNLAELTWAIGGSEAFSGADDENLSHYPERCMAIWHMDDSLDQLQTMATICNFIGVGSCAEYDVQKHRARYMARLREASAHIDYIEISQQRRPWVHLMRGLGVLHQAVRFDSADSSNIARNHNRKRDEELHVRAMADRLAQKVEKVCVKTSPRLCRTTNFGESTHDTTNSDRHAPAGDVASSAAGIDRQLPAESGAPAGRRGVPSSDGNTSHPQLGTRFRDGAERIAGQVPAQCWRVVDAAALRRAQIP